MKISGKRIIFFFPYYHVGGAERVHADVVKCLKNPGNLVIFTDRSRDDRFKQVFRDNARCFRFFGVQNKIKIISKILVCALSFILNRYNNLIIIGSNSMFFYQLLPRLKNHIKIVDIIHSLSGPVAIPAIINTARIERRVVVTPVMREILNGRYRAAAVDDKYLARIKVIENQVEVPNAIKKDYSGQLKILFIGRNSPEKRPGIAISVYKSLIAYPELKFVFIGRGLGRLFKKTQNNPVVIEKVNSDWDLNEIYNNSHFIILTSSIEGFPFALMEAMAYGVVPIATPVGGIPYHINNQQNGILINAETDELIIGKFAENIMKLNKDRGLLAELSCRCHEYAKNNFNHSSFCLNYKKIINGNQ
jgi:glycosyltransferase involved in cell wall biosynthesis